MKVMAGSDLARPYTPQYLEIFINANCSLMRMDSKTFILIKDKCSRDTRL